MQTRPAAGQETDCEDHPHHAHKPCATTLPNPPPYAASRSTRHVSRPERTGKVLDFETARRDRALTQQHAADNLGVPRTTLLGWIARAAATELTPAQRAFFESPEGASPFECR